jgi:predicted DNA-binding protein (MmcQ/YjbR family)
MRIKPGKRSRSKHQHWVPQFYLRCFATKATRNDAHAKVWIFSKESADGDEKLTNIRNVCGKRYLYSPMQANGERDWALDERLDDLESLLGRVWPTLADGYVELADPGIRKGLALFTAVMYLRNPEVRLEVERIHSKIVNFYESAPRLPDGSPDIEEIEINGQVHSVSLKDWHDYRALSSHDHDQFFAHLVQSEATRVAEHLLRKRWSVVCTDEETFITTDKPVAMHHQSKKIFGFGTQGTIVTLPLSPTRMLVFDDITVEPTNQYYPLKNGNGPWFNLTTWRNAARFLITGRSVPVVLEEMLSLVDDSE